MHEEEMGSKWGFGLDLGFVSDVWDWDFEGGECAFFFLRRVG